MLQEIHLPRNPSELFRKSILLAQEEARRLGQAYVGTELLLMGLLRVPEGRIRSLLSEIGVEAEDIYNKANSQISTGAILVLDDELPFTRLSKSVFVTAFEVSQSRNCRETDIEHLLLALAYTSNGMAAQILADAGVSVEALEKKLPPPAR